MYLYSLIFIINGISSFTALIYIPSKVQPEDGSNKPKHVAKNCKFIQFVIKSCIILYFVVLFI